MIRKTFPAVFCLLLAFFVGSGTAQSKFLQNKPVKTAELSKRELDRFNSYKNQKETIRWKSVVVDEALLKEGEIEISLFDNNSARLTLESRENGEVWKGKRNGLIEMSLRKGKYGYVGYVLSEGKLFNISPVNPKTHLLVEKDITFKCGVE